MKEWFGTWAACAAFYLPAAWLADSVIWAAPALIEWSVFGYRLDLLRFTSIGLIASGAPRGQPAGGLAHGFASPNALFLSLLVLLVAAGLARAGRANRVLSGLAIGALGNAAMVPALAQAVFSHTISISNLGNVALGFAILSFGLRRMISAWPARAYWKRVLNLVAGYVPLPVLAWVWIRFGARTHAWPFQLALAGPGVAAALLVSLPGRRGTAKLGTARGKDGLTSDGSGDLPAPGITRWKGWKTVGWGAVASLLINFGSRRGELAIQQARRAKAQAVLASLPHVPVNAPYPKVFFQKGVNFTAEFPATYDSRAARAFLAEMPRYGINAIALVPYGWSDLTKPRVERGRGMGSWENDTGLEILARVAHADGMKVMLKPAVWRAFDIKMTDPVARARWFDSYRRFILHYAQLAREMHADILCVGGEFVHLTSDAAAWRALIAQVRQVYPGPLVYAANFGTEFEGITFWDALDDIGIQEYYPLPDSLSTDAVVARIKAVQKKYHRPVIFTEVGFPSLASANRRPWDDSTHAALSLHLQARCAGAILSAFYSKPWFQGMYWWKIQTNGGGGSQDHSHNLWDKPALQVVAHWYRSGER